MEEPSHQTIPDQWPARSPKRSHSQMSAEHRQAHHDGLSEWIREATRTPAPNNLDQIYLTTPAPPSPPPFHQITNALRLPSPIHLDLRRSVDLRRPADPTRPPRQQRTASAASMPGHTNDVPLIDLTDDVDAEDDGEQIRRRQQEEVIDLGDDAYEAVDATFEDELERIFNQEHANDEMTPESDQDRLFVRDARPAARGPRFGRDIIDLSEDTTPPPQDIPTLSPEVQFVRSRARSTPPPPAPDPPQVVDITNSDDLMEEDDDDEIQFVREIQRVPNPLHDGTGPPPFLEPNLHPGLHGPQPGTYMNAQWNQWLATSRLARTLHNPVLRNILGGGGGGANAGHNQAHAQAHNQAHGALGRMRMTRPAATLASLGPLIMNYTTTGFNIMSRVDTGTPSSTTTRPESPIPVLDKLASGFFRAPQSDNDVMVCPHCGDELGLGDSDAKRQVWMIKACGHTYCGDCTIHRFKNSKGKAKATSADKSRVVPEPFSVCCVDGCVSKISTKTTMIQLYF